MLGKRREASKFKAVLELTRQRQPLLMGFLAKRPLRVLELADQWPRLLDIVSWIQAHPRPGIYLRQVDIPGVHSKFIEAQRGILTELLDRVLPAEVGDSAKSGINLFSARYGFRDKPERIRFRVLDSRLSLLPGGGLQDISLDADSFARLPTWVRVVFITENETNFLAFPLLKDSMVIFGAGYGWEALSKATWLSHCEIYYWGDIDTHGFAILDQLRIKLPHVVSFLMDSATLLAHQALWGLDTDPCLQDLPRLSVEETALYNDLRDNRIQNNLRLEQEMIGFGWVEMALCKIIAESL